jgi:uroporphyrin-III C-methyltransferase/precorrin-2 dehydrogenase/sirohydrochlorin ferrochelatase
MRYFPLFFDLRGKTIVICGGGFAAANKLRLFMKTEARIRVAAQEFSAAVLSMANDPGVALEHGDPASASYDGAAMVIAATESEADAAIARRAQAMGLLVNAVDKTELCSFITPSIIDRDPVVIAIGTEGSAPVLARRLRERIESETPDRLGALARLIGENREAVERVFPDTARRRAFWESIADGTVGELVLRGAFEQAALHLDAAIQGLGTEAVLRQAQITVIPTPPHEDLLTLKALRALQDADLILHQVDTPPGILDRARRDAQRFIYDTEEVALQWAGTLNPMVAESMTAEGARTVVFAGAAKAPGMAEWLASWAPEAAVVVLPAVQAPAA